MFLLQRMVLLIVGVLALTVATPAAAQTQDSWFAYLLNDGSPNHLIRVNLDGESSIVELGLNENNYVSSIAFSSTGQLAAYCVGTMQVSAAQLVVRDLESGDNVIALDFGENHDCFVSEHAFNDTDTQVAVGSVDRNTYAWQFQVLDLATGSVTHELNQATAAASGLEIAPFNMPATRAFADNELVFGMLFWGGEAGAQSDAYRWNLDTNQVEAAAGKWRYHTLNQLDATGEAIYPAVDMSLPAGNPGGPMDANNVLMLETADGETRIIYHNPGEVIARAKFVDNGAKIAMWLIPDFESAQPTHWVTLDRQGNVEETGLFGSLRSAVLAAPDGMLMLWSASPAEATTITMQLDYITDAGTTTLWTGETDRGIALVWASPVPVGDDLPDFPIIE